MSHQPSRRPRILEPDPITQIGIIKEKLLKEAKQRLAELGIIVKIPLPAGTVMEIHPSAALDHLVEKGCPHMMVDFLNKTLEVEAIFETIAGAHLIEKMMEMDKKGCR